MAAGLPEIQEGLTPCPYASESTASAASAATSFRAAKAAGADIEWVAVNDLTDAKTLAHLLKYDSILGPVPGHGRGDRRRHRRRRRRAQGARRARPGRAAVGRPRRRRRHRVDRLLHRSATTPPSTSTRGAKKVIISAPAKGEDITVVLGVNFDKYDPDAARRHLQRVVHDELPRAVRQGRQRRGRHQARPDDDDPRLHGRPEPAGRAAQGPAPRPRRRDQPRPDVDRRRQGRRPRAARAQRQAARLRGPRARSRPARSSTSRSRPSARRASRRSTSAFKAAADTAT